MREIKFRAWNGTGMIDEDSFFVRYGKAWLLMDFDPPKRTEFPLMPYTGLNDIDGVKIYEGDIVRQYEEGWNTGGFGDWRTFVVECVSKSGSLLKDCEVIGNIYENPELLEKESD